MPTTLKTDAATATATIEVDGRVTKEDFDRLVPEFEAFIDALGTVRLIEIIHNLEGFDAGVVWKGFKLDMKVIPHISHCAVVGDIGWMSPVAKAAGAVISTKLRTFSMDELDAAKAWIADPDA
ncbi:MAG: STAS/SEC14 domain-containing protein [Pseudomonadota bacterium]